MKTILVVAAGEPHPAPLIAELNRLGVRTRHATSPDEVLSAPAVVFAAEGDFGAAMTALTANGLGAALKARVLAGKPLLAIGLAFQLLAESSEESPGTPGLGVLPAPVERFPTGDPRFRVPHHGWNAVLPEDGILLVTPGWAYFNNTSRISADDPAAVKRLHDAGWVLAVSNHAGCFVVAAQKNHRNILACQFHPEFSDAWGSSLLRRWLASVGVVAPSDADECEYLVQHLTGHTPEAWERMKREGGLRAP